MAGGSVAYTRKGLKPMEIKDENSLCGANRHVSLFYLRHHYYGSSEFEGLNQLAGYINEYGSRSCQSLRKLTVMQI